jgi:beta-lactamase family protein
VKRSRGGAALAALCAGLAIAPAPAAAVWHPGIRSAKRYAHTRAGDIAIAVRTSHRLWAWHGYRTMRSASVLKAMLLVAYLDDPRVRHRDLRAADHALIDPMIRRSDNTAASRVLAFVGPHRVRALARRAGMRRFKLDPVIWGLSQIDAVDQSRFFLHIDERVVPRHRRTALHLLESIVPSQRWGIGRVKLPGWHVYFKGGWGSGTGAVEHQVVLLCRGDERISLAVLTTSSPSHEYAKQTLRGIFARLLRHLH